MTRKDYVLIAEALARSRPFTANDAMRASGARAIVAWRVEDVQSLVPEMSAEDAMAWLENNESNIADRMTERGWDAIYDLLKDAAAKDATEA